MAGGCRFMAACNATDHLNREKPMSPVSIRAIARYAIAAILLGVSMTAHAQQPVLPVWPDIAPGSENWKQKEVEYLNPQKEKIVRNVVRPTLTAFLPDRSKANGTAVIVCPGGGFRFLSWQTEGTEVAEWLRDHGVAAF